MHDFSHYANDRILARLNDAAHAAENDLLDAINRNGIGSDLNQPYRDAFQTAEDRIDARRDNLDRAYRIA